MCFCCFYVTCSYCSGIDYQRVCFPVSIQLKKATSSILRKQGLCLICWSYLVWKVFFSTASVPYSASVLPVSVPKTVCCPPPINLFLPGCENSYYFKALQCCYCESKCSVGSRRWRRYAAPTVMADWYNFRPNRDTESHSRWRSQRSRCTALSHLLKDGSFPRVACGALSLPRNSM